MAKFLYNIGDTVVLQQAIQTSINNYTIPQGIIGEIKIIRASRNSDLVLYQIDNLKYKEDLTKEEISIIRRFWFTDDDFYNLEMSYTLKSIYIEGDTIFITKDYTVDRRTL